MELKKILVTGANGQLGNELRVLATEGCPGCEFLFTDIAELDICNAPAVESYVEQNGADVIINCAAFTAVDKAESEEALARKINADAPGILARAIEKRGGTMEIIEEPSIAVDLAIQLRTDGRKARQAYLVPSRERMDFSERNGILKLKLPKLSGGQIIAVEWEQ